MKTRSIKFLSIIIAIVCTLCAMNITSYADEKLATPKVKISATTLEEPTLKLSWEEVDGANKYYIYRRDTKNGSLKLIAKTSKLYYKDTNVSKNKTYYYKVRAYQIKNNKVVKKSDASSTVSKAIVSVDKVKTLKAVTVSDSKIKLSWDKVNSATRYYVYYSTSKNGTYKSIGYTTKTNHTFSNLNSSTTYYFKVKSAKVLDGKTYKSSYSSIASAKTNSKDGEFIVDFKKISNKEAGLPTGSAITCLAMVLNHYGVDVSAQELYKYFDCSTDFYYNDEGKLYGPHIGYSFVGDPTSNKAYGYGTAMAYIGSVQREYFKKNNINDIKVDQFEAYNSDNVVSKIKQGNIILARIRFDPEYKILTWRSRDSIIDICVYEKYVIVCGVTDKEYIVYDPAIDKFEKYAFNFKGYHPILSVAAYKNK